MALGTAVGAGGGGPSSPGVGGTASGGDGATPAAPTANVAAVQAPGVVAASPGGGGSNVSPPPGHGTPSAPAQADATHKAAINSIAAGLRGWPHSAQAGDLVGPARPTGDKLAHGAYVATGGSFANSAVANSIPGSGGGSSGSGAEGAGTGSSTGLGPATGSFSGTTSGSTIGSSSTGLNSQTGSTSSGGTYTYPGYYSTNSSGGSYYVPPVTGKIHISGGGNAIISGGARFDVVGEEPNTTLSNISWSSSGAPVMYSSQTIPNPATATQFTQVPYIIGNQTTSTVGFYWGEKIGVETLTANASVSLNGQPPVAAKPAEFKVFVCSPGVSGEVIAAKSASGTRDQGFAEIQFGTARAAGINWGGISPTKGGQFQIVQIINNRSISITPVPGGVQTGTGCYKVDKTTNPPTYTPAPFPLIDVEVGSATPFYASTNDSPTASINNYHNTTDSASFTDYVLYSASNGAIWVPEGKFNWTYSDMATWTMRGNMGGFRFSAPTVPTKGQLKVSIDHSAWPQDWSGVSESYLGYKFS